MAGLKILIAIFPFMLMLVLLSFSEANREILVGGKLNAWTIPSSSSQTLNVWAEKTRFKVGDVLMWKSSPKSDSVVQVTKEDYDSCKSSKAIREVKSENAMIELEHSGPFYFISGVEGNCEKGVRLIVVVLSEDHWRRHYNTSTTTPAPAPARGSKSEAFALKSGVFLSALLLIGLGTILLC